MITMSERDTFIAAHVTPRTKEALRAEADSRKVSMSALIAQILVDKLEDCGHDLSASALEDEPMLPLETQH
jgi:hypothetical protein